MAKALADHVTDTRNARRVHRLAESSLASGPGGTDFRVPENTRRGTNAVRPVRGIPNRPGDHSATRSVVRTGAAGLLEGAATRPGGPATAGPTGEPTSHQRRTSYEARCQGEAA